MPVDGFVTMIIGAAATTVLCFHGAGVWASPFASPGKRKAKALMEVGNFAPLMQICVLHALCEANVGTVSPQMSAEFNTVIMTGVVAGLVWTGVVAVQAQA